MYGKFYWSCSEQKNYQEAKAECGRNKGILTEPRDCASAFLLMSNFPVGIIKLVINHRNVLSFFPQCFASSFHFFISLLQIESWIGATDIAQEGVWKWASDGSVAGNYSRQMGAMSFDRGQPNNNNGNEYCAAINKGKIKDENCDTIKPSLCELPGSFDLLFIAFV